MRVSADDIGNTCHIFVTRVGKNLGECRELLNTAFIYCRAFEDVTLEDIIGPATELCC